MSGNEKFVVGDLVFVLLVYIPALADLGRCSDLRSFCLKPRLGLRASCLKGFLFWPKIGRRKKEKVTDRNLCGYFYVKREACFLITFYQHKKHNVVRDLKRAGSVARALCDAQ